MMIGAGPSGGGKSSIFPIFQMQIDAFRADLRAATLLGEAMGARKPVFQPASARRSLCTCSFDSKPGRRWSASSTSTSTGASPSPARQPFGRSHSINQARRAHLNGFRVEMLFIAGGDDQ